MIGGHAIAAAPDVAQSVGSNRGNWIVANQGSHAMNLNLALLALSLVAASLPFGAASGRADALAPHQQLARDVYQELIEINTVTATGDTARAAEAMADRLRAAGFEGPDLQVLSPAPRKGNLVARLRGTGVRKPIMLLAHIDVVEARREDWSVDPFKLTEQDGYFYGRGTIDDKFMAAAFVANMIRYRQEGYKPDRDIVLVLETDEEVLDRNAVGIRWLLQHHRNLIDADFALNEGAGARMSGGRVVANGIQTSEKIVVNYRLEVRDPGGHSSVPLKENPIYRLAEGLARLAKFDFPFKLNDTTRAYFERAAQLEDPQTAADMRSIASERPDPAAMSFVRLAANPLFNAQLRTTCVATMLEGGHAVNALPQLARATVNCRVLPGEPVDEVQATLTRVLADDRISVTRTAAPFEAPASALNAEIMGAVEKLSNEFWPGVPVIPTMTTGGTSGTHLRNAGIPTYGHSGLAAELGDARRIHGRDERILVKSFFQGQDYLYRLVKMLAGGQ
jgi:acetylornithine deacetylase/succinyl-diaminopimelate desuccinylase-like protein